MLLSKGAKINALNNGGCSTLHVAVNKQHSRCVRVLLRHKAQVNIQVRLHTVRFWEDVAVFCNNVAMRAKFQSILPQCQRLTT